MRITVVGAGVGGMGCALALARAGHEVAVLEQDATPVPPSPEEAFWWDRRGAPQVRHSHAFLARLRNLLRDRFPDVLDDLLAAGATEMHFAAMLPGTVADRAPRPGDDDLVALACRRTTFEWVLRRAVATEAGVSVLDGVRVTGLVFASPGPGDNPGDVPAVNGARLGDGGPSSTIGSDMVVVAGGPRSALPQWLAPGGVVLAEEEEDTGIIYFSRFYQLLDGVDHPDRTGPIGGDLGYCKYAVFDGDNRTFSVTLACGVDDREVRSRFGRPEGFDGAALALTATRPWVDEAVAEPITGVHLMAGLVNRRRWFLDGAGAPVVLGLHALGDAHTCTNPLYGRGCSLAMVQAVALADAVGEHPHDPAARSRAYEAACDRDVLPWYRAAVAQDQFNRDPGGPGPGGALPEVTGTPTTGDQIRSLLQEGLMPAVRTDADVFRSFLRSFNLLDPPEALMSDPHVVAQVLAAYQARHTRPPEPALGPNRDELLAS